MADIKQEIISLLLSTEEFSTLDFANKQQVAHSVVVGAVKSLELNPVGNLNTVVHETKCLELTPGGEGIVEKGSPEFLLYQRVGADGCTRQDLQKDGLFGGFNFARGLGWVAMAKDGSCTRSQTVDSDTTRELLKEVQATGGKDFDEATAKNLIKRKIVKQVVTKYFHVQKGPNFTGEMKKFASELTEDMIRTGEWKNVTFKPYNFAGAPPNGGYLHPLLKVRAQYRQKFLEMGFTEMPTNNWVESSFWNFDSLFQPQQHPARDAHDTFFLSDPREALELPEDYLKIVKETHENGGATDSIGYNMNWSEKEARKNLLRTHTTAVSARMLKKLAEQKPFKPSKFFSIDRVFRNETMDSTHLAEFHQIEGVIVDYNLTLADLIGILHSFFQKLGINNLRFKPAYNPYTEPSMEIFSYHEGLKKWVEIGNSGMFRPEMLEPMGLPKDVACHGFGLSLERPTMIMYGFDNIRDLVGHKVDLKLIKELPICNI